jgi:hypothetical protein
VGADLSRVIRTDHPDTPAVRGMDALILSVIEEGKAQKSAGGLLFGFDHTLLKKLRSLFGSQKCFSETETRKKRSEGSDS